MDTKVPGEAIFNSAMEELRGMRSTIRTIAWTSLGVSLLLLKEIQDITLWPKIILGIGAVCLITSIMLTIRAASHSVDLGCSALATNERTKEDEKIVKRSKIYLNIAQASLGGGLGFLTAFTLIVL